jgi:hypothetical protein
MAFSLGRKLYFQHLARREGLSFSAFFFSLFSSYLKPIKKAPRCSGGLFLVSKKFSDFLNIF